MVVLRETKHQKEYIDKKGIHVIIGQYMGKGLPWESTPNLTSGKTILGQLGQQNGTLIINMVISSCDRYSR